MVTDRLVCIRTEGNGFVGMGHVGRCLALAEALRECGFKVVFALSSAEADRVVGGCAFDRVVLGEEVGRDAAALARLLEELGAGLLIIDSYEARDEYVASLRSACPVLMFCEGGVCRGQADIVYDYNLSASEEWFASTFGDSGAVRLVGPRYAPLKRQYWDVKPVAIRDSVNDVLITSGGTDPLGICEALAAELVRSAQVGDARIHVAIGPLFGRVEHLRSLASRSDRVLLHEGEDLSALLSASDLVIAASGTTVYEVMRFGVPAVFYSFADNQVEGQDALMRFNHVGDVRGRQGELDADAVGEISRRAGALTNDARARADLSAAYTQVVDGQGARRVACAIDDFLKTKEK